jgi:hypothetical protein
MGLKTIAFLAGTFFLLPAAHAQNPFLREPVFGEVAYSGPGCPAGSVSATFSPDRKALSLLFDQFIVEAGRSTGRPQEVESCIVSVPVSLPNKQRLVIHKADYRGFLDLPEGGWARLVATQGFFKQNALPKTSTYAREFVGPKSEDFYVSASDQLLVKSPCGGHQQMRITASMTIGADSSGAESKGQLDSADLAMPSRGVIYRMRWESCND